MIDDTASTQGDVIVLIIDDDPTVRLLMREYLEQAGFSVVEADNGRGGLHKALTIQPDLILLDIMMPELDGFSVCETIQSTANLTHIPIIIVTGLEDTASIYRGLEVGASDFITKPIAWRLLEHRVRFALRAKSLERNLRTASIKSEAANTAKSRFLANMSHELRTPLNAIIGFGSFIQNGMVQDWEKFREYAGDIVSSGEHLLRIINDVLDLCKMEEYGLQLHERVIALADLINMSIKMIDHSIRERNMEIAVKLDDGGCVLRCDETRLCQVLMNILSNAVKFTPVGGRILVSAHRTDNGDIKIVVSDNGIGIAAEDIPRLCRPFEQGDDSLHRSQNGTGLGLPLSIELIELHKGSLKIESKVGAGTTVSIVLPSWRVHAGEPALHSWG